MRSKIKQLESGLHAGDFKSLARAITVVENEVEGFEELLLSFKSKSDAQVIGITGPPGAGKSTLVNALLKHWLAQQKRIAVLAVDPSSPFNYGALLGDRVRMAAFYTHPDVYIRSLASRGALGGLSAKIVEILEVVKQAPFDFILVETVGVGQSEVEIAGLADCSIVALVPEAGDVVQTLKAGIMEIADVFVVNKADREAAETLYQNLKMLAHEKAEADWEIPVIKTVALKDEGIEELTEAIQDFFNKRGEDAPKKLQLLTEKAWQLLQTKRMRQWDKQTLQEDLESALKKEDFNLYAFVQKQLARF